jgi:hypothetical protein
MCKYMWRRTRHFFIANLKCLTTCTAVLLALSSIDARAAEVEVGTILKLDIPKLGCTFPEDTQQALRIEYAYGPAAADAFVKNVMPEEINGKWRFCYVLSPRIQFTVEKKWQGPEDRDTLWFCVQPPEGINPNGDPSFNVGRSDGTTAPKPACLWARGPENPSRMMLREWTVKGVEPWRVPVWRNY